MAFKSLGYFILTINEIITEIDTFAPVKYILLSCSDQPAGEEHYTSYISLDGVNWTRGGTWTHKLGSNAQIGLVSMGGSGFTANFDYVRVYELSD